MLAEKRPNGITIHQHRVIIRGKMKHGRAWGQARRMDCAAGLAQKFKNLSQSPQGSQTIPLANGNSAANGFGGGKNSIVYGYSVYTTEVLL
jgi:hypothetical protein